MSHNHPITQGIGTTFVVPHDETFPVYHQSEIQKVIGNAVKWACPEQRNCLPDRGGPNAKALEKYELEDENFVLLNKKKA